MNKKFTAKNEIEKAMETASYLADNKSSKMSGIDLFTIKGKVLNEKPNTNPSKISRGMSCPIYYHIDENGNELSNVFASDDSKFNLDTQGLIDPISYKEVKIDNIISSSVILKELGINLLEDGLLTSDDLLLSTVKINKINDYIDSVIETYKKSNIQSVELYLESIKDIKRFMIHEHDSAFDKISKCIVKLMLPVLSGESIDEYNITKNDLIELNILTLNNLSNTMHLKEFKAEKLLHQEYINKRARKNFIKPFDDDKK